MANENFGSTVLHEHRKVVTLRHLLALVNFIAIFASTLVTRHFVLIRGTSDGIMLIINLLCAVNIVQIILCIVDYITKVLMGKYFNKLTIASYIVGVVWFGMVVAEFISGSVNLGDVRVDLGIIAILQLASALIAYIVWPHIDYATIRKMTHKNVRENPTKRAKKATGGVVKYVLVCVLMLVVQFGMLLAYKLPPNVYDLFSESRQLQYTLSEDGESYEVIGVYVGTSTYVNVPATYNNKPVTKIREGALSNASFLEINKITKIDFGSPAVDDDGNDIIVSNVNTIEKGAIVNDKITTLTLPSSVTRIDNGAIKSASLKKLVYEAQAQFSYPYLDCSSLATITFSGLEAGKIVSLEGMDSSVTLEVPKDTYNNYREKNNEYMASIRPILESNEYVIDFYTDSDYYIESIFAFSGEVVELGYNDLKNDKYDDKTAPSVDTLSYLKDKHELGTNGAKADSAFRGWYYDRNFTDEVDFSSGKITISDNTAIYAKWIDEYTGTLDWGTYHPDGQPNTLYWTDEDLVSFPVIDGREGFKNGIVWTVNGSTATSSQNISESVTVKGTWVFDKPTVDINPYPQNSDDKSFAISTDKNTVSFVYDETQKAIFEGIMTHVFDGKNGFSYSTEWYRTDSSNIFDVNKTTSVQNVAESGTYILKVTAISPYGDRSVAETQIDVVIDRKELNIGSCALKNDTVEYNSWNQTLTIEGTPVHDKIEFTYNYYDMEGNLLSVAEGVKNAGTYRVVVVLAKNNAQEAANYGTKELTATLVIQPKALTFDGWSSDELSYNTSEQRVYPNVVGICPGDIVNILYKDGSDKAKNVGTYNAEAIGVDNANYTINGINNATHIWKITPQEITVKQWILDGAVTNNFQIMYNGEEHVLEAIPEGVFESDLEGFEFVYDQAANTVAATNANKYTAKIIGVNTENYVLISESTQDWEITKRPLAVYFDSQASEVAFTYNGSLQGVNAILSGIASRDLDSFSYDKFSFNGMSDAVTLSGKKDGDNFVITFAAKDVATYNAQISGIINSSDINLNYTLTDTSKEFKINPKTITVSEAFTYEYSGALQTLAVRIDGIEEEDIKGVTYDQFTSETLKNGMVDGEYYLLTMTARDVGNYSYDVSGFSNPNYNLVGRSGTLNIEKKRLTVEWEIINNADDSKVAITDGTSLVYNAVGYVINAKISGLVNDETVTLNYVNGQGTNAGDYVTKVSLPAEYTNYVFDEASLGWKITPYVVDFAWQFNGVEQSVSEGKIPEFVYSGSAVELTPVYTLLGTDTISINYVGGRADISKTDADTATYKVSIADLGNSNYTAGANSAFEWKINPKVVNVTWTNESKFTTYNGQYQGPQFTISGVIDNDLYVQVGANFESGYMHIASTDATSTYNYSSTGLIINASDYACTVNGIYTKSGSNYTKNNNYVISGGSSTYTVNKASLTLSGWLYENKSQTIPYTSTANLIYNASNYVFTNAINETLFSRSGETDNVYLAYNNNTVKNAGDYKTTVYLAGNHADNYVITGSTELVWKLNPKEIKVNWASNSFVYSGSFYEQYASYETGARASDDYKVYTGDSLYITYSNYSNRYAGDYTATITSLGNTNYKLNADCASYNWSIAPKEVKYSDLTWDYSEFTYNGQNQYPTAYYYDYDLWATIYVSTYDREANSTNASADHMYVISATELNSTNYVLVGENRGHEYKINPRVVNFSWIYGDYTYNAANDYIYDGNERVVNAYVNNKALSSDVINITYNKSNRTVCDANTYVFTVTGIDNPNYVLDASSGNVNKSIKVSPREIELTWGYDGATTGASDFTYDGVKKTIAAYVSNLCGDDTSPVLRYSVDTNRSVLNAGSYTFTVEPANYGNYVISAQRSKNITVARQQINVSWNGTDRVVYDGYSHTLDATLTGTINGKTINMTPTYSDKNTYVNAGTYNVVVISFTSSATGFNSENFVLPSSSSTVTRKLVIDKQVLTITWSGTNTLTYDTQSHALVASVSGTIAGKTVTATPVYYNYTNSAIDAGTYSFTVNGIKDATNENMNLDNFAIPTDGSQTKKLTISKYVVNINWIGKTEVVYDGKTHRLDANVTGVGGAAVAVNYSNNDKTTVGTYTVSVSLVDSKNYQLPSSNTSKALTITPQPVKITWSGTETVTYVANAKNKLTATVVGKNDGKAVAFKYNTTSFYTDAGEYVYSITLDNKNYTLEGAEGDTSRTLTINPQPVDISWIGTNTIVYDGKTHAATAKVVGRNNKSNVGFSYNTTNSYTNVGEYTYSITLTDKNYVIDGDSGKISETLKITPQPVKITWSGNDTYKYTGQTYQLTYTVVGKNDGVNVTDYCIGTGTKSFVNEGKYSYTITGLNHTNYTLEGCVGNLSATATITPMVITVKWTGDTTVTYDGRAHYLEATVTDEYGNTVNIGYTYGNSRTNVGTTNVVINFLGVPESNYTLKAGSSLEMALTIVQSN